MIYTTLTKKALKIAFEAHKYQIDKSGMPYIFHPFHLAEQMKDEYSTCVALLHDVVEDTDITIDDLKKNGFPREVTEAVELMTHKENVPYFEYIESLRKNPVAVEVKLFDLVHNSDLSRLETTGANDIYRIEKYKKAISILANSDIKSVRKNEINGGNSNVRRAVEKDIPKILDLLVQVDMVHHTGRPDIFKGPATKYNEYELKSIINNENTPVFVYTDENDNPSGHAFCIHRQYKDDPIMTDIKTLYIDDICVDADARGKHIGKTLFEYIREYAVKQGFYNITLNVWSCNPSAMSFYRAMGLVAQKTCMEMIL